MSPAPQTLILYFAGFDFMLCLIRHLQRNATSSLFTVMSSNGSKNFLQFSTSQSQTSLTDECLGFTLRWSHIDSLSNLINWRTCADLFYAMAAVKKRFLSSAKKCSNQQDPRNGLAKFSFCSEWIFAVKSWAIRDNTALLNVRTLSIIWFSKNMLKTANIVVVALVVGDIGPVDILTM